MSTEFIPDLIPVECRDEIIRQITKVLTNDMHYINERIDDSLREVERERAILSTTQSYMDAINKLAGQE